MLVQLLLAALPASATTAISIDAATVDGLEIHRLDCVVERGGLTASAAILAQLASQDPALDGCAPQGAAFSVQWQWLDGRPSTARVTGSTATSAAACVEAALVAAQGPQLGSCSAVLLVGEPVAASRAWHAINGSTAIDMNELPLMGAIVHTEPAAEEPAAEAP